MKRLAFILLALVCCVAAFGQAFTPRRPFIPAGGANPFSPSSLAGMAYWWNADDLTNLVNQPVNSWTDRIQQVVFTNYGTATYPTYTNYGLRFNGVANILTNSPGINLSPNDSIFVALSRQANGNQMYRYLSQNGGSVAAYYSYGLAGDAYDNYNSSWVRFKPSGTYTALLNDNEPLPYNNLLTLCTVNSGGFSPVYTNGILAKSVTWGNDMFNCMGDDSPSVNWGFVGPLYEIIVYTNLLTATDVSNLNQYAQTWSVKSTIISFTTQPTSIVCLTNTIQSFTATANGSVVYQWRTNSVPLADGSRWFGVNTNVLWVTNDTTLFTNLAMDCVATNLYYAATSSAAYLSVYDNTQSIMIVQSIGYYDFSLMTSNSGDTLTGLLTGTDRTANHYDLRAFGSPKWYSDPAINNGKGFVRFLAASSQCLQTNYGLYAQPTTIWMVASNGPYSGGAQMFFDDGGDAAVYQGLYGASSLFNFNAGTPRTQAATGNRWRIWEVFVNGASSYIKTNGVTLMAAGDMGANGRKGVTIGADRSRATFANEEVAFMAIYTNIVSASQSNIIYSYLSQGYTNAIAP